MGAGLKLSKVFASQATSNGLGRLLTILCISSFALSVALIGVDSAYGIAYAFSMLAGLALVPQLRFVDDVSRAVRLYFAATILFGAFLVANVLIFDGEMRQLDNPSRLILGAINGFFLLSLFGGNREYLYRFLIASALFNAIAAIAVACFQGVSFLSLELGDRVGGNTNPIPFSEVLAVSAGLVALAIVGRAGQTPALWRATALAALLSLTILALILAGSRGTFLAAAPLALLIALASKRRPSAGQIAVAAAFVIVVVFALVPIALPRMAILIGDLGTLLSGEGPEALSPSNQVRLELWINALDLAFRQPLFGYGLGSFPGVFADPSLGIPADSVLRKFNHLHNQYLDLFLETGIAGLALFCVVIGIAARVGLRALDRPESRIIGLSLLWVISAYVLFGLSTTVLAHASTSHQLGVYAGILLWCAGDSNNRGWLLSTLLNAGWTRPPSEADRIKQAGFDAGGTRP
ncbi:MAG: O-antigen ligase family protein [Rhizobiaceae bacterium]|nr:O-antigen ligase family protein [Rhizobiaceae bacterium]